MRPYVLVFLPAFIAGCSCDDHPSVSAPTGPQGGINPTRQQVTNDNPPPEIWVSLDPSKPAPGTPASAQVQAADLRFAGHQPGWRTQLCGADLVVLQCRPQRPAGAGAVQATGVAARPGRAAGPERRQLPRRRALTATSGFRPECFPPVSDRRSFAHFSAFRRCRAAHATARSCSSTFPPARTMWWPTFRRPGEPRCPLVTTTSRSRRRGTSTSRTWRSFSNELTQDRYPMFRRTAPRSRRGRLSGRQPRARKRPSTTTCS